MKTIDFTQVDITMPEDWQNAEEEWCSWFDERPHAFSPYRKQLEKLQTIVGFGRGFWAGVHGYFYLVYHTEKQAFYWFLRDYESDVDVFFYEVNPADPIFPLLVHHPIRQYFDRYDETLDYDTLSLLAKGRAKGLADATNTPYEATSLEDLFGEDTEELRIALMAFQPASWGSYYPHTVYDQTVLAPVLDAQFQASLQLYQQENPNVFAKNGSLFIQLGNETFQLIKEKTKK